MKNGIFGTVGAKIIKRRKEKGISLLEGRKLISVRAIQNNNVVAKRRQQRYTYTGIARLDDIPLGDQEK